MVFEIFFAEVDRSPCLKLDFDPFFVRDLIYGSLFYFKLLDLTMKLSKLSFLVISLVISSQSWLSN